MNPRQDFPEYRGRMSYRCLGCDKSFGIDELLYTCPECGSVLLLSDGDFDSLKKTPGSDWREIFDLRAATKRTALKGIFRFYELMAPVLAEEDIVYLGEGDTPIIDSSPELVSLLGGQKSAFKNDGQNPSASFKDRGMACAFSYLKNIIRTQKPEEILAVCASTGDTSAAAALYAAYVGAPLRSVVILPGGKVTPQQLAQPLGSGAVVLEVPGVFDDCMKVVEHLADNYNVALLNSKNSWRILGQESYAFEVAQHYGWNVSGLCLFVPIGNAGNVTAIMSGFLKLKELGITHGLPRIFGVQSEHADPVFRYYDQPSGSRIYKPVPVTPSVAQAAMIGNPVSFPRVQALAERMLAEGGPDAFQVVQVSEQEIIEGMLIANRHGHISCTQGGECLAGLMRAREAKLIDPDETAVLDATAHMLKFIGFQEMYFENSFPAQYEVTPRPDLTNRPEPVISQEEKDRLGEAEFTRAAAEAVVARLGLTAKG